MGLVQSLFSNSEDCRALPTPQTTMPTVGRRARNITPSISFWRIDSLERVDRSFLTHHSIALARDLKGDLCMSDITQKLAASDDPELQTGTDDQSLPAPDELELPSGENREKVSIPPISIEIGTDSAGESVMATQAIINRQAQRLDTLREDVKRINDSLKSILDNDEQLSITEHELKESTKKLKERKAQLTQSAESVQLKYKMKEVREQIKELEESLNNHLLNYYQLTGTKVFDTDSGEQREFRVTAKILGKKMHEDKEE